MVVCSRLYVSRSSYPDAKDGDDVEMRDGALPDMTSVEFDDDTLELTLPSGTHFNCHAHTHLPSPALACDDLSLDNQWQKDYELIIEHPSVSRYHSCSATPLVALTLKL